MREALAAIGTFVTVGLILILFSSFGAPDIGEIFVTLGVGVPGLWYIWKILD